MSQRLRLFLWSTFCNYMLNVTHSNSKSISWHCFSSCSCVDCIVLLWSDSFMFTHATLSLYNFRGNFKLFMVNKTRPKNLLTNIVKAYALLINFLKWLSNYSKFIIFRVLLIRSLHLKSTYLPHHLLPFFWHTFLIII